MVTVVLPGEENKRCAKALCTVLERYGGAVFADESEISDFAPVASVFFVCNGKQIKAVPRASVLLLTDEKFQTNILQNGAYRYIVADADTVLCTIPNSITVGMGKESLISVSSIEDSHLQICIQRPVKTFSGKEILPCEFSVYCAEKQDVKTVLFAFAVLLLSDKADTEKLTVQI